jgi:hypothetical protein
MKVMIVPAIDVSMKEYYGDNFISFRYIDEVTGVVRFRDKKKIREELIYDDNDNPDIIEIPNHILESLGVKI